MGDRGTSDSFDDLSAAGERRREQILCLARRAAATRRRRRATLRIAGGVVLAAVLATGVLPRVRHAPRDVTPPSSWTVASDKPTVSASPASTVPSPPRLTAAPTQVATRRLRPFVITRVETDHDLARRLAVPARNGRPWQRLSDDELLRNLSETGRPAGLAYLDGHAFLLFRTDPATGRAPAR